MDDNKLAGCFGKLALALLLAVLGSIMGGWALSVTWRWFIVPVFSAPTLTIAQAIGVGLVVNLLTSRQTKEEDEDESWIEKVIKAAIYVVLYPLMAVGIGWIIKGFL